MHPPLPNDAYEVLESLLRYLEKEYYTRIEAICARADLHIVDLISYPHQPASLYASLSKKLTGQVGQFLRLRRFGLVPYIHDLLDKEDTGHDCRSCSSSCTIRHTAQLTGIREAHIKIKETLYRLQSVAISMYGQDDTSGIAYRTLRAEMMQLDTALTELFYLEESSLIPKIIEMQHTIHAHD